MKYLLGFLFAGLLFFSSCNTSKNILYFQDIPVGLNLPVAESSDIVLMPKDMVSIVVSSKDAELAMPFNLPRVAYQAGSARMNESLNNQIMGYTVDTKGCIDFPILGNIQVQGLTRKQLSTTIKERLIRDGLLKDPVVTVDFMNLKISVLGEVKTPGKYSIERDRMNILEVISMAGDLTIYGKRDRVFVIREKDGGQITYRMDMRSPEIFSSPAYYLQQNDIVYVEPNNVRAGQSTVNDNNVKSISLWLSVISLAATLSVLIFKK